MNWNPLEQRQIFQRQATGYGHFEAHIGQTFDRADIGFTPRHACGLRITAAVINHLLETCFAPLLRLLPGPETGQFNLHVAIELLRHVQRAFRSVDIRTADHGDPVGVGFKAHARENFARIGDFGIRQHDFMRIERLQVTNRTNAFAHAQNGADFDDVHFFRNQTGGFVSVRQSLVIQRDLQHW